MLHLRVENILFVYIHPTIYWSSRGMTGNTRNAKVAPGPPSSDPKSPLDPRQLRRGFQSWHFGADFVRKAKIRVEKNSLFLPTDAHRCPPMPAWLPMAKNTRNPKVVYCENKVVKNFLIFRDVSKERPCTTPCLFKAHLPTAHLHECDY